MPDNIQSWLGGQYRWNAGDREQWPMKQKGTQVQGSGKPCSTLRACEGVELFLSEEWGTTRLLPVLFRVSIAVIKHHSQKQLRDRGDGFYFNLELCILVHG